MDQLEIEITKIETEIESLQRIDRYHRRLSEQIKEKELNLEKLNDKVEKEYLDVIEAEKWSIFDLLSVHRRFRSSQLEKEKAEYLRAAVQLKEAVREIELLKFEQEVLQDKLNTLPEKEEILTELRLQRRANTRPLDEHQHQLKKSEWAFMEAQSLVDRLQTTSTELDIRIQELDGFFNSMLTSSSWESNTFVQYIKKDLQSCEPHLQKLDAYLIQWQICFELYSGTLSAVNAARQNQLHQFNQSYTEFKRRFLSLSVETLADNKSAFRRFQQQIIDLKARINRLKYQAGQLIAALEEEDRQLEDRIVQVRLELNRF